MRNTMADKSSKAADDDDIDEGIVEKVGENKAVPLLPQGDEEKELVIHVPEETAKSAEIGVLSALVILIVIASAIAVAYFVYDRKRQKKIKECVDKLQKTEEGKKHRDDHKYKEPSPPAPFRAPSESPSRPFPFPDGETTETGTSEEPPDSDVNTEVSTETELNGSDANNNRDRNANATGQLRNRRCCLCFCCPPHSVEPSLEEIWQQKKSQINKKKSRHHSARQSLRVMAESMKYMEGHKKFHKKIPRTHFTSNNYPAHQIPNRHRRHGSQRRRSQSLPAPSHKFSSLQGLRANSDNKSCWTEAAMLKRSRSLSAGRDRRKHSVSRQHRHGVVRCHTQNGLDHKGRKHNQVHRWKSLAGRGRSQSPHCTDHSDDNRQRTPSHVGDRERRLNVSRNCHCLDPRLDKECIHHVKSHRDKNQSHHNKRRRCGPPHCSVDHSRRESRDSHHDKKQCRGRSRYIGSQSHGRVHCAKEQYYCDKDQSHSQVHHVKEPRYRDNDAYQAQTQDKHGRCPTNVYPNPAYCYGKSHIPQIHNKTLCERSQSHQDQGQRCVDKSQNQLYFDSKQSQDQSETAQDSNSRSQIEDFSGRRHKRDRGSPIKSYDSRGNLTESSMLYSDQNISVRYYREHQNPAKCHENQNQAVYWPKHYSHSTLKFFPQPYSHPSKGGYVLTRTVPNTIGREESPDSDKCLATPEHCPYRYGFLNVSQNYNCEDSDMASLKDGSPDNVCPPSLDGTEHSEDRSGDQNDELSDNGACKAKGKIFRKRSLRPRFRRLLTQLKSFHKTANTKSHKAHTGLCIRQDSSTSSGGSSGRDEMVNLTRKLFGLKLTSTKRPKRRHQRHVKKKKKKLSHAADSQPLLGDNQSWDSEETTNEASKGTELFDGEYGISTFFPSSLHHTDFTLTSHLPWLGKERFNAKTDSTSVVKEGNDLGQTRCRTDRIRKKHSPMMPDGFHLSSKPLAFSESGNSVFVIEPHDIPKDVDKTWACRYNQEKHGNTTSAFQYLREKSNTNLNPAHLGELSEDDKDFRKLATERWCKLQMQSAVNLSDINLQDDVPFSDNGYEEEFSAILSSEAESSALLTVQSNPEFVSRDKSRELYSSMARLLNASPMNLSLSTNINAKQVEEAETPSSEMDHGEFSSFATTSDTAGYVSVCSMNQQSYSDLESSDLFGEFAAERIKHCEERHHFLSSKGRTHCNKDKTISINSGRLQTIVHHESPKNCTIEPIHHPQKFNEYVYPCESLVIFRKASKQLGKRTLPKVQRNEQSVELCTDRSHLSASILPPDFLKDK